MNEKNGFLLKISIIVFYSFVLVLHYSCTNGGHFEFYNAKNKMTCNIEGKKISTYVDDLDVPYIRFFILGNHGMYCTYHINYEDESGKKNSFITYKFPYKYGLDVVLEKASFVIEETLDNVKIYYNNNPTNGFVIENNPFSKKLILEYTSDLKKVSNADGNCSL